ncbi:MAG: PDZ domain-containing protein [Firmicutes bacterium]|nr:PDZ domain-containing protein [Bacillota bacterium]
MFPARELMLAVLRLLPLVILEPSVAGVFWLIVLLTVMQYKRLAANEERIYGAVKNSFMEMSVSGLLYGLVGGIVASLLLVFVGVSLTGSGISYLLPLAFLLYMINPRLMCFSYAGGIVSLSNLLFGWPRVSVPGIMALVGVLHITESVLIRVSGSGCSTPVYLRSRSGRTVGGFSLQRFWPMPLVALVMLALPDPSQVTGLIQMPDWWPLVRPAEAANMPDALFAMWPIVAALGYSDVAVTCPPAQKARRTSLILGAYSVSLLGLAIASAFVSPLQWVAALFGPLGHELVIAMGSRRELSGVPAFVPPERGVMVLDVLPGSPAQTAGLRTGDIVTEVTGTPVNTRDELREMVRQTPVFLELSVRRGGDEQPRDVRFRGVIDDLGIIPVPEEGDPPHVELGGFSPGKRFVGRLRTAVERLLGRR